MTIEVERKAFVSKEVFAALPDKLAKLGATDLGQNDTETVFFITDREQIKVQRAMSKSTAKLTWKSGGLHGAEDRG
jgi:hypothetical protein